MKTASWFTKLPDDHKRIGISRGTPRRMPAGYRVYKALAPGPWFNSVSIEEYYHLYRTEILGPLDPRAVADHLTMLAGGLVPVLLCYERPPSQSTLIAGEGDWCHRAMVAEWLAEALGVVVPEVGFESLPQHEHTLMPPQLRRVIATIEVLDVTPYIGRTASLAGGLHRVVGPDPAKPGHAILAVGERQFSTGGDTLRRYFNS
jgi:hypothetical protein